jgi:hypothetical protein
MALCGIWRDDHSQAEQDVGVDGAQHVMHMRLLRGGEEEHAAAVQCCGDIHRAQSRFDQRQVILGHDHSGGAVAAQQLGQVIAKPDAAQQECGGVFGVFGASIADIGLDELLRFVHRAIAAVKVDWFAGVGCHLCREMAVVRRLERRAG